MYIDVSITKKNNFTLTFQLNNDTNTQKYFNYLLAIAKKSNFKVNTKPLNRYAGNSYRDDTLKFPLSLILDKKKPFTMTFVLSPDSTKWEDIYSIFESEMTKQQVDFSLCFTSEQKEFFHALYKQPWLSLLEDKQIITVTEDEINKINFNLSQFPDASLNTQIFIPEFDLYDALLKISLKMIDKVYKNNFNQLNEDLWALTNSLRTSCLVKQDYNHSLVLIFSAQLNAILVKFQNSLDKDSMRYLPVKELRQAINHSSATVEQNQEINELFGQIKNRASEDSLLKKKAEKRPFFAAPNTALSTSAPNSSNDNNSNSHNIRKYNSPS